VTTSWQFGLAPNFPYASLTPNSASTIRILCQGNLHIYAMEASKLVAAMRLAHPGCDVDGTKAAGWAKQLDGAALQKLGQAMPVWYHMAKPDEVVYVPTGFMTIERADNGPLIYGVRKSLLFDTPAAVKNYSQAIQLIAQGGGNTDNMEKIKKLFKHDGQ